MSGEGGKGAKETVKKVVLYSECQRGLPITSLVYVVNSSNVCDRDELVHNAGSPTVSHIPPEQLGSVVSSVTPAFEELCFFRGAKCTVLVYSQNIYRSLPLVLQILIYLILSKYFFFFFAKQQEGHLS